MKYVQATNIGKGFITHEDRALGDMSGYGGDIYVVSDNHTDWITRINGTVKTKKQAEAIVLAAAQENWDNDNQPEETPEQKVERLGERPSSISLP
jgi:hypothetical protein